MPPHEDLVLTRAGPDFWPSCGYGLLAHNADGHLVVTDEFLRHLLARPEFAPIASSCAAELALHGQLLQTPQREVAPAELSVLKDRGAADNYAVWLRFRARLLAAPTLEASYLALFQGEGVNVAPLLVQQLTQVLLRHVLGQAAGEEKKGATALEVRAAEMLFRTQKISILEDGAVMAADDETVQRQAISGGINLISELLQQGGVPQRSVDLDVLSENDQEDYWSRSEHFDLVLRLNHGQPALDALCRVLERWIAHFLQLPVRIQIDREIADEHWVWHVGLDAQASSILNDMYTGVDVNEDRMGRLMCLFRLTFANPADMLAEVAGRPVYLAMATDENHRLNLKPQNLLLNLPLARS
jgi:hypothetical protein